MINDNKNLQAFGFMHKHRYITSDCDAVATIYEYQNYTKSPEDAVAIALKAGFFLTFQFPFSNLLKGFLTILPLYSLKQISQY